VNEQYSQLFELAFPERLQLVEDLWDSIAAEPDSVPIPDWQKEELAKRKADYLKNPASGVSWEEVKERLRKGNG